MNINRISQIFKKMIDYEKTFRIILYVVLIIVAVLFIYAFIWMYYATNALADKQMSLPNRTNLETFESDDEYMDESYSPRDAPETPKYQKPREYNYQRYDHGLSLSNQPQQKESTLNYQEFREVVFTDAFLKNYHSALRNSLNEKEKIYKKKYKDTTNELKATQKRVGSEASTGFNHDSNLDRLRRASVEIKEVLTAIQQRMSTLSIDTIKRDFHEAIHDPVNGLDSLVGRDDVKDILALQIFTFARNPKLFFTSFQNITIYGRSGVGKTKLAETIGFVYSKSGILVRRKVRNVTKQELTSSYVNESGQLTREVLMSTWEGVLFIDEAYDLCPPTNLLGRSVDHGGEAVAELVNFLDKNTGLSIVIAAGYEQDMEERFMGSNQGLDRRFPHKIKLGDYSQKQLTDILLKFMGDSAPNIEITDVEAGYIYTLIDFLVQNSDDIFSKQAGDMLNLSNIIVRSIYGSVTRRWTRGKYKNNAMMILDGFNDYLRNKGLSISPGEFDFCQANDLPTPGRLNHVPNSRYSQTPSHSRTPHRTPQYSQTPSRTPTRTPRTSQTSKVGFRSSNTPHMKTQTPTMSIYDPDVDIPTPIGSVYGSPSINERLDEIYRD